VSVGVVAGAVALLVIGARADDVEALVELDVDLAAVVERDLDLVVALLVAYLGLGHPALAGLLERCGAGLVQGLARDGRVRPVVVATVGGGDSCARPTHDDGGSGGQGDEGGLTFHSCLLGVFDEDRTRALNPR